MSFTHSNEDQTVTLHHYKKNTGEYIDTEANRIIKRGGGLPASSTVIPRIDTVPDGHVEVFNEDLNNWNSVKDNRGLIAYTKITETHENYTIEALDPIPSTHTLSKPEKNDSWDGKKWSEDQSKISAELILLKSKKASDFSIICGNRIRSGFVSNILGFDGVCRCNRDDQEKMRTAKESGEGGKIWVNEVFTAHSQSEAETVYNLAIGHIDAITTEYSDKYSEIQSATTRAAVEAITWPE